ncbi:MAG: hypothetical protein IPI34_10285 [bacterium]|nr:hypothetical protein [bacterium]
MTGRSRWWAEDGIVFAALLLAALASMLSVAIAQLLLGVALLAALVRVASRRDRPARTGLELPFLLLLVWALATIPCPTRRTRACATRAASTCSCRCGWGRPTSWASGAAGRCWRRSRWARRSTPSTASWSNR